MMVATTPGGVRFYSNDGQVFYDGEVTIYSPGWLPEGSVLSSTKLNVSLVHADGRASVSACDLTSGYVFAARSNLTVPEAVELVAEMVEKFTTKEV